MVKFIQVAKKPSIQLAYIPGKITAFFNLVVLKYNYR